MIPSVTRAIPPDPALPLWHNLDAAHALWRDVIDPHGIGLQRALAEDLASFSGESVADVSRKMERGKEDLKRLWEGSAIDIADAGQVEAFYREQFVEAYELAYWHSGLLNGYPPLNYPFAALFARQLGLRKALDFGSGIGTGSLCLASVGCEVHSADIAQELLRLVKHRLMRHGFEPHPLDLSSGDRPRHGYYDLITCFDVLEHIPNHLAKLRELTTYLRPGGYLLVNLMQDSSHPDRPMHISSAGNWLALVRKTALRPDWSHFAGEFQALRRAPGGRAWNAAATLVDWYQGQCASHRPGTPSCDMGGR